ncbi:MAG: desulfoferrodoxin [Firmicutes bacterium]|nr:desulfoferrodoxin [Bacillota bacterium]
MTKEQQIYKCEICGNIVEVVRSGKGQLVCCGQPMALLEENTTDAAREKHVPELKQNGKQLTVKVGSTPHPMAETHFIEWIELIAKDRVECHRLTPGNAPETTFDFEGTSAVVRAYCNLHGLWKTLW